MNEINEQRFRDHAVAEYPRECCGVLVIARGRELYLRCRNIAETPQEHFIMSPEDYASACDLGELVGICHSHPDIPSRPSQGDLVSCENEGVTFHIVSVNRDGAQDIHSFNPTGYEAPLVGRKFEHGLLDCYSLIRDWYAREQMIELPDFVRRDDWWLKGENLYLENFENAGFEIVTGKLQVGDIPLMQIRSKVPNHAGVYIGDGMILHHLSRRLSSKDIYDGYYQEITQCVVRRKK